MLIPRYWAEHREKFTHKGRRYTLKRFGWSDESWEKAMEHAVLRVKEAREAILSGSDMLRREPKVPYNGADGVPIREEIVETHDDTVITRNSYGALCLNTPDVLFADVDFESRGVTRWHITAFALLETAAILISFRFHSLGMLLLLTVAAFALTPGLSGTLARVLPDNPQEKAMKRIRAFVESHPQWRLRVYRTPAGMRLLAMHRTFSTEDPEVHELFAQLGCDPMYVYMCRNQRCFRARITPKPWRVGVSRHIVPRRGVWPVDPEMLPAREEWVREYENSCRSYAACRFLEELGEGHIDRKAETVRKIHDDACRAASDFPIA